jgi:hypothetical protein
LSIPGTRPTLKVPEEHWISMVELPEERSAPRSSGYSAQKKKEKEKEWKEMTIQVNYRTLWPDKQIEWP